MNIDGLTKSLKIKMIFPSVVIVSHTPKCVLYYALFKSNNNLIIHQLKVLTI